MDLLVVWFQAMEGKKTQTLITQQALLGKRNTDQ